MPTPDWPIPPAADVDLQDQAFISQFFEARAERHRLRGEKDWPPGADTYVDGTPAADMIVTDVTDNLDGTLTFEDSTANWTVDRWIGNPDPITTPYLPSLYDLIVVHVGADGIQRAARFQIDDNDATTLTVRPMRNYRNMKLIDAWSDLQGDEFVIIRRDNWHPYCLVFGRWPERDEAWIHEFGKTGRAGVFVASNDESSVELAGAGVYAGSTFPADVKWRIMDGDTVLYSGTGSITSATHLDLGGGDPALSEDLTGFQIEFESTPTAIALGDGFIKTRKPHRWQTGPADGSEPGDPTHYDVLWFNDSLQRAQITDSAPQWLIVDQSDASDGTARDLGKDCIIIARDAAFYSAFNIETDELISARGFVVKTEDSLGVSELGNKAHRIYNFSPAWYRGARVTKHALSAEGVRTTSLMPARKVRWEELDDSGLFCVLVEHPEPDTETGDDFPAYDRDMIVSSTQEPCDSAKANMFFAPDLYKTWRELQVDREGQALTFIDPFKDYDFLQAVENMKPAMFYNAGDVNAIRPTIASHTINQIILDSAAPYDAEAIGMGLPVHWVLLDRGQIKFAGVGTLVNFTTLNVDDDLPLPDTGRFPPGGYDDGVVSGVDQYYDTFGIKDPSVALDEDWELVVSPGHTRRFEYQTANPFYPVEYFVADFRTVDDAEVIDDPPTWQFPGDTDNEVRSPGHWESFPVSTKFWEFNNDASGSRLGYLEETSLDMFDGEHDEMVVRFVAVNRGDGIFEDMTDGDSAGMAEYTLNAYNGHYRDPAIQGPIDAALTGTITSSARNWVEDNTKDFWSISPRDQGEQTVSSYLAGTPTGGSATTIVDTSKADSPFFEVACNGLKRMVLELDMENPDTGDDVTFYIPITDATPGATPTITFATPPDAWVGWSGADATAWRVRWPKTIRNRMGNGRLLRIAGWNGTSLDPAAHFDITTTLSDKQRIFFAPLAVAPPAGLAWEIIEFGPAPYLIRDGQLIVPPHTETDPRSGAHWPKNQLMVLPHHATRYGFHMHGDVMDLNFFEEHYRLENALSDWMELGAWTSRHSAGTPEYNTRSGRATWNEANPTYPDLFPVGTGASYPSYPAGYSNRAACVGVADDITAYVFNAVTPNSFVHGNEPAVQASGDHAATWIEGLSSSPQSVRNLSGHETYYEGSVSRGHPYDDQQGGSAAERTNATFAYATISGLPTYIKTSTTFRVLAKRPGWESEYVSLPTPIWRHEPFDFGSGPVADRVHTYIQSTFDANGSPMVENGCADWDALGASTTATRISAALGNNDLPAAAPDAPIQSFYEILFDDTDDIDQDFSDVISLKGWVPATAPLCILSGAVAFGSGGLKYINRG